MTFENLDDYLQAQSDIGYADHIAKQDLQSQLDEALRQNEILRKRLVAWQYAGRDLIRQLAATIDQHADIVFYVPKENGYQDSFVLWHNMHNKRAVSTYKAFKRLFDLLAKKG